MTNMKQALLYTVTQFSEDDETISFLETGSPVVAISDFTIKTKMFYKNDLSCDITIQQMPGYEQPEIMKMISIVKNVENNQRKSVIYLETKKVLVSANIEEGFSPNTQKKFTNESYIAALSEVAKSFSSLSGGNLEIMKIIAVVAGKDPDHELWKARKAGKKHLALG